MTPAELDMRELTELAERAGCTVLASSFVDHGGRRYPVLELDCADNEAAIRFTNFAAQRDAKDPEVRALALSLQRAHPTPRALAIAIHDFVKTSVSFVRELGETFQHSLYTLSVRAGDCEDHARVVTALAFAAGLQGRVEGLRNRRGAIAHAVAQIFDEGAWRWAETTIDAAYGEDPRAAARRLKVTEATRADMVG